MIKPGNGLQHYIKKETEGLILVVQEQAIQNNAK